MSIPGRKPKPPALRVIEGNPSGRPIPHVPRRPTRAPRMPDVLRQKKYDVARREWERVVPDLDAMQLVATVDRALLLDYCICWQQLCEANSKLTGSTLMKGRRGQELVKNPAATIVGQLRTALRAYIAELGLSPSSRSRLAIPCSDEGDELLD